ncbi:MAG: undecaprenyl-diphosphate phosphatase, partial [Caldilineae bacterium]
MFGYIQALVLGLIQGATEFLPVSSSGHLTIAPWLLGWPNSSLLFDTVVHWGTLLAILVVFWRDFLRIAQATLISLLR